MKKSLKWKLIGVIAFILAVAAYYYVALPAINIHAQETWGMIIVALALVIIFATFRTLKNVKTIHDFKYIKDEIVKSFILKLIAVVVIVLVLVYGVGTLLSSPIINAKKYQQLLTVEERVFTDDIKEISYDKIPILDKNSSIIIGNRKMGSMVDMVSQYEVNELYTQINYNGKPVRVSPLRYASAIKWFTNRDTGIPAYMCIDMTTQSVECVKLEEGIKYTIDEHFGRNLFRHLRFNYPTYIFDTPNFEIDDDGVPYWICPVKEYTIGLFGGVTIGKVITCNAITGECTEYDVEDAPTWIDKVYSAELLVEMYDYHGTLKHGYFNSILGQKDCLQTTNGYNYIALEDDVWVYTGITSVSSDQSNVGFVLMNQRTKETRFYEVEGAIEDSAMSSAEGQVQNLQYVATFPLLLNISDQPTYFIALKDAAGLVKKYAMVNVQKYQMVAIGDTVKECEQAYIELLNTNNMVSEEEVTETLEVTGVIEKIVSVVVDGNTHFYIMLTDDSNVYDVDVTEFVNMISYEVGDEISIEYADMGDLKEIVNIDE